MQRNASATWEGDLKSGKGTLAVGSGAFTGPFSFVSRFEGSADTNPEELLGAAHAGCYSMALSNSSAMQGHPVTRVHTTAAVTVEKTASGFGVTRIDLKVRATIPGMSAEAFAKLAEDTKVNCIISKALSAVPMTLDAALEG